MPIVDDFLGGGVVRKPAQVGTPWSLGHQHAHALRIVGKELLRDMWLARHEAEVAS